METFTIGLGNHWWVRAFGRNPLVRRSDRIEAIVLVFAVMLTVIALPIAGAYGTFVHDERARLYAEEAQTRHQVIATATEDGSVVPQLKGVAFTAEAMWNDAGRNNTGEVVWSGRAKAGDQQNIWVDSQGEFVGQPSSQSRADSDAVVAAMAVWLGAAEASVALVYLVRRWLDRWRYAEWDRQIRGSHNNDDRRNHQS
jgi:hypothetical protein